MPMSEAHKRANKKWNDANMKDKYDRIQLVVPKGRKDIIQSVAKGNGESLNAYIIRAVEIQMHAGDSFGFSPAERTDISLCQFFSHAELEKISAACREGETAEDYIRRVVLSSLDAETSNTEA